MSDVEPSVRHDLQFKILEHAVDLSPGFEKDRINREAASEDFRPTELIRLLKDNPFVAELMQSDAGVAEGYTVEQHAAMVMGQFERYFGNAPLPVGKALFRTSLALHDVGKPLAMRDGIPSRQGDYNGGIVKACLKELGYSAKDSALMQLLVSRDPVGTYLKGVQAGKKGLEKEVARVLHRMQGQSGLDTERFWNLLKTYYLADASSYTTDAGGKYRHAPGSPEGLDRLFEFDRDRGILRMNESMEDALGRLEDELYELDDAA